MITAIEGGPFHAGELQAQARAGIAPGGAAIRNFMPEQHRTFFASLPFLCIAATDRRGQPAAAMLTGPAGFVSSPDPRSLHIALAADWNDPIAPLIEEGQPIGMLGIDFSTRRRNRANGLIAHVQTREWQIGIQQSFGNCPRYIQTRDIHDAAVSGEPIEFLTHLHQDACRLISHADAFFVASTAGPRIDDARGGTDISHRGGQPGFVRIDGDTLTIPDFNGNRYFNTLGNLLIEPRAALLFVDFLNGDVLHLQGSTEILWDTEEAHCLTGAERLWRFHVTGGWRKPGALPFVWTFRDYAASTSATGTWERKRATI
ncbi:pyridoxamine 5'-phosphate oxidase family protein [Paralcaligenes ginsengisoli]